MNKALKFKYLVFCVASLVMLMVAPTMSAQNPNLITNGDFTTGNTGFYTEYAYTYGNHVVEAGHYRIDNTTSGYGGGSGWPQPSNSHGNFMMVNGYGNTNPGKVVWQQTVNVTTQTRYTLSYRVVNLNQVIYGQIYPAKIQVKINGSPLGGYNQLPSNNNWQDWSSSWYNSTNTEVTITIIDVCTDNPGYGDDFCLDDISFVPEVYYSVDANNDPNVAACLNQYVDIDVLANDVVTPNTNDANVTVVTEPTHGSYEVRPNKKIRYTFTGGGTTDQIKYRVTTHGAYDEAWVYINTGQVPVVASIAPPDPICVGEPLGIPTPTVTPNTTGHWESCQTQSGSNWQQFDPSSIPLSMNNYYVRYAASNNCGDGNSNAVQIHVNDEPTIGTPSSPPAICAGNSFNLTTPSIQDNGSSIISQGWQIAASQNGNYNTFNNENVPYTYNGYYIRYYAENDCGLTYSPSIPITVNDVPIVGSITAPGGICAGEAFNLTTPSVTWRHTNQGTGSWEIQINGEWQPLTNNNIPFEYNGCNIRYKAVNGCGTTYSTNNVQVTVYSTAPIDEGELTACDAIYHHGVLCNENGVYVFDSITPNGCSIQVSWQFNLGEAYIAPLESVTECDAYYWSHTNTTYYTTGVYDTTIVSGNPMICDSTFTLNLTINQAPTFTENLQAPYDICVGGLVNVQTPSFVMNQNGGTQRWEYATSANGPFQSFDPATYHIPYGNYYLRFVVINDCDSIFSNVVQFHVNDAPEIVGQLAALEVCEDNPLDLPEIDVQWKNYDENDRFSEWQMANSQNGVYASFNPAMPMQMAQNGCWIRFYAHNSCGDAILGPVAVSVISVDDQWLDPIPACDSFQLPSGEVLTQSQVVEYEEFEPCFHIIYQPIVINHSDHVQELITSCHESYDWHGQHFERSDVTQYAQFDTVNIYGCDSIIELQLNFGDYNEFTENLMSCGPFEWEMNPGHIYYESQRDSVFVPAVGSDDCDSWYYLVLTLGNDTVVEGAEMQECSGFVWHGVPYYEDAVVYDSLLTAVTRCDSVVSHYLRIIQPMDTTVTMESCSPIWWQGHQFMEDGDVFTYSFTSQQGCDSIVTIHFSLTPEIDGLHTDTVSCESFQWYEHFIDSGGTWSHRFLTSQGCDSIGYLDVTFIHADTLISDYAACSSYEFNGISYGPGGYEIYHDTVLAPNGCVESVQLLRLTVKDNEQLGVISGQSSVYVATNLISGIYRYTIDNTDITGGVTWHLDNPDWVVLDYDDLSCQILVTTPGSGNLIASFMVEECGEMERRFFINAGFYGVEENGGVDVSIYPNPTDGMVTVEAEGIESIRVINMIGQTLDMQECGLANSVRLNMSGYTPSVYLFEIKTVNGWVKKRVVLCR